MDKPILAVKANRMDDFYGMAGYVEGLPEQELRLLFRQFRKTCPNHKYPEKPFLEWLEETGKAKLVRVTEIELT